MHWHLESFELLDSTNLRAIKRVRELWSLEQAGAGLVISAQRQSKGRGQHGRAWESPPGGLYFSAVIESPPLPVLLRDKLALVAGVAVAEALETLTGGNIALRWPNDVLLRGKKVAGILCESIAQGDRFAAVVGIGVNVNTRLEDLPAPLRKLAGSLADGSRLYDLNEVQGRILARLSATLELAAANGLAGAVAAADQRDSLRGKALQLEDASGVHRGIGRGIGPAGELLVETQTETLRLSAATLLRIDGVPLR